MKKQPMACLSSLPEFWVLFCFLQKYHRLRQWVYSFRWERQETKTPRVFRHVHKEQLHYDVNHPVARGPQLPRPTPNLLSFAVCRGLHSHSNSRIRVYIINVLQQLGWQSLWVMIPFPVSTGGSRHQATQHCQPARVVVPLQLSTWDGVFRQTIFKNNTPTITNKGLAVVWWVCTRNHSTQEAEAVQLLWVPVQPGINNNIFF